MSTDQVDEFDEQVGRNVQELRKARGLTQTELAERLAARGLPFRQQTVVKVEKGQRPLRLQEADAIASVLAVDIDVLADEPITFDSVRILVEFTNGVAGKWEALREATRDLLESLDRLRHMLRVVVHEGRHESLPASTLAEAQAFTDVDPVRVVAQFVKEAAAERDIRTAQWSAAVEHVPFRPEDWS